MAIILLLLTLCFFSLLFTMFFILSFGLFDLRLKVWTLRVSNLISVIFKDKFGHIP